MAVAIQRKNKANQPEKVAIDWKQTVLLNLFHFLVFFLTHSLTYFDSITCTK